ERPFVVVRLPEVEREHRRELLEAGRVQTLQRLSDLEVKRAAVPQEDRAVGGLLGEAVMEGVLALGAPGDRPDEPDPLERVQPLAELGAVAGDRVEKRLRERSTDHGRELQRAASIGVERVETSRDQRLEGRG